MQWSLDNISQVYQEKVRKETLRIVILRTKAGSSSSIERKCPCMKKLKGEGNFPSYFDDDDVILHIIAKVWI